MQRNQMPLTTGLADQTPMANVGKMKSVGWDGNIAFTQQIGQVSLQLRGNFTYQKTDILDMDEAANELWYKMNKGFQLNQSRGFIAPVCLKIRKTLTEVLLRHLWLTKQYFREILNIKM